MFRKVRFVLLSLSPLLLLFGMPVQAAPKYKTQHLNELYLTPLTVSTAKMLPDETVEQSSTYLHAGEELLIVRFHAANKNDVPQVLTNDNLLVQVPGRIYPSFQETASNTNNKELTGTIIQPGQALDRDEYYIIPVHASQYLLLWEFMIPIDMPDNTITRDWALKI